MKHLHISYYKEDVFISQPDSCGFRINQRPLIGYSTKAISIDDLKTIEVINNKQDKRYTLIGAIDKRPFATYHLSSGPLTLEKIKPILHQFTISDEQQVRLIFSDYKRNCHAIINIRME